MKFIKTELNVKEHPDLISELAAASSGVQNADSDTLRRIIADEDNRQSSEPPSW